MTGVSQPRRKYDLHKVSPYRGLESAMDLLVPASALTCVRERVNLTVTMDYPPLRPWAGDTYCVQAENPPAHDADGPDFLTARKSSSIRRRFGVHQWLTTCILGRKKECCSDDGVYGVEIVPCRGTPLPPPVTPPLTSLSTPSPARISTERPPMASEFRS